MNNQNFKNAEPDSKNSHYRYTFYFSNGEIRPGYTGKKGFSEAKDSRKALKKCLERLYDKEWFDSPKTANGGLFEKVEIFKNTYGNGYEYFATLFPSYIEFADVKTTDRTLGNWLVRFISELSTGLSEETRNTFDSLKKKTETLDLSTNRFAYKSHLQCYCKWVLDKKLEPVNRVQEFYRKYCEMYFREYDERDQRFYESLLFYKP